MLALILTLWDFFGQSMPTPVVDVRPLVEITGSTRVLPVSRSRQTAA
jgi:hypothetical protein